MNQIANLLLSFAVIPASLSIFDIADLKLEKAVITPKRHLRQPAQVQSRRKEK